MTKSLVCQHWFTKGYMDSFILHLPYLSLRVCPDWPLGFYWPLLTDRFVIALLEVIWYNFKGCAIFFHKIVLQESKSLGEIWEHLFGSSLMFGRYDYVFLHLMYFSFYTPCSTTSAMVSFSDKWYFEIYLFINYESCKFKKNQHDLRRFNTKNARTFGLSPLKAQTHLICVRRRKFCSRHREREL
jgi:hypothetical protein